MTIRLNTLYLLIFIIPIIFLFSSVVQSYHQGFDKVVTLSGANYRVCSSIGCKTYPKEAIENPIEFNKNNPFLQEFSKAQYDFDIILARQSQNTYRFEFFVTFIPLFALVTFLLVLFLFFKITYTNGTITMYTPFPKRSGNSVTFSSAIQANTISKIYINTNTPLIAPRKSIEEINWRDSVYFDYMDNNQQYYSKVELFYFPGFKTVVLDILKNNPKIELLFHKNTIMDNLQTKY